MLLRNIATVTEPELTDLTTLERVKMELSITSSSTDELLEFKIAEASSDIEAHLARKFASAEVSERFWGGSGCEEYLLLDRFPVTEIESVTVDDDVIDDDEYRVDPETGILYRLDASGYPCAWTWCKDIVVVYTGGYDLPGSDDPTLPPAIEAATVELVTSYWTSRGRDPTVKSDEIPGIRSVTYWVGAIGANGDLPPSVASKIAPFRKQTL